MPCHCSCVPASDTSVSSVNDASHENGLALRGSHPCGGQAWTSRRATGAGPEAQWAIPMKLWHSRPRLCGPGARFTLGAWPKAQSTPRYN